MKRQDILDILGIEDYQFNRDKDHYLEVVDEFKQLAKKHDKNYIWLKGDTPYYEKYGKVVEETKHLVALRPYNVELCLFDILSEDTKDKVFEELNDYLLKKYGRYNRGFGYDEKMTINNIEWEDED